MNPQTLMLIAQYLGAAKDIIEALRDNPDITPEEVRALHQANSLLAEQVIDQLQEGIDANR